MTPSFSVRRAAILAILAAGALVLIVAKLREQPLFIDFLAMWTGGRLSWTSVAAPYDPAVVDHAQAWLLGAAAQHRPFPYPPTSLLIFSPLARLDLWSAGWLWLGVTAGGFLLTVRRLAPQAGWADALLIGLFPASAWAAVSGQCVFLTGALILSGLAAMERRPWLAGILLGLAAAFKPTILLAAPAALVAARAWKTLFGAGLTGAAVVLLSLAVFGLQSWIAWLHFAPGYLQAILQDPRYVTGVITPAGLAVRWGLPPSLDLALRAAGVAVGVCIAAVVFARRTDIAARMTGLIGGSLLASPYAMTYETLLLAPGAVWLFQAAAPGASRRLAGLACGVLVFAGLPPFGAYGLPAFLLLSGASLASGARLRSTVPAVAVP